MASMARAAPVEPRSDLHRLKRELSVAVLSGLWKNVANQLPRAWHHTTIFFMHTHTA
jgi:hypothetical protein